MKIVKIYFIKDEPLQIVEVPWINGESYYLKNKLVKSFVSSGYLPIVVKYYSNGLLKYCYSPNDNRFLRVLGTKGY